MSGLSSVGSALASSTSGTSSPSSATSLLSLVGQSLLSTGQAPNATPSGLKTATTSPTSTTSSYQAEFLTLQQQDTAELLYASFLSPTAGLENADEVLGQAAQLLGTPGSLATAQSTSTSTPSTSTASSSSTGSSSTTSAASSPSSTASSVLGLPSVSSILAASDAEAQQTLAAYGNAPSGSSIIDYQA